MMAPPLKASPTDARPGRDASARQAAALRRHVARLDRRVAALERRSGAYSWLRLGVVLAGMALAFVGYRTGSAPALWGMGLAGSAFAGLVVAHRRLLGGLTRYRLWRALKAAHLARITRDWAHLPPPPAAAAPPGHPFAADLNLTGPRSLLHLADTAVSQGGSDRLRDWLLAPVPEPARIDHRQALVRELAACPRFRDRLALQGALVAEAPGDRWDGEGLLRWLVRHTGRPPGLLLGVLFALSGLNVVLVAGHALGLLPALWPFSLTVYAWVYLLKRRAFLGLFDEAFHLERTLRRFRAVLRYLETYPYPEGSALGRLCAPFTAPGRRPSVQLRRIARIALAANSQKSEVLWLLLNTLMPWDLLFAWLLERYKADVRAVLPRWLDVWYDLEALCSLATLAALNPGFTLPEVVAAGPLFEARGLGHPLLPRDALVRSDFRLEGPGEMTLITGSNMSGKSTFLRTLGVNLALAYAGGPVDAAALHVRPCRLFTCIQVTDSVQDGISYFYAEVRRLKALLAALEASHPAPLVYLIDEIFRGTNNRERLVGSRAFVRALAEGRGAGVLSTHDLDLVRLEGTVPGVHNAHFRETVREGRMVFDYRLRPGPCPTTNALKIMAMEGLPVDEVEPRGDDA